MSDHVQYYAPEKQSWGSQKVSNVKSWGSRSFKRAASRTSNIAKITSHALTGFCLLGFIGVNQQVQAQNAERIENIKAGNAECEILAQNFSALNVHIPADDAGAVSALNSQFESAKSQIQKRYGFNCTYDAPPAITNSAPAPD
jgi:hypothetical protein